MAKGFVKVEFKEGGNIQAEAFIDGANKSDLIKLFHCFCNALRLSEEDIKEFCNMAITINKFKDIFIDEEKHLDISEVLNNENNN